MTLLLFLLKGKSEKFLHSAGGSFDLGRSISDPTASGDVAVSYESDFGDAWVTKGGQMLQKQVAFALCVWASELTQVKPQRQMEVSLYSSFLP